MNDGLMDIESCFGHALYCTSTETAASHHQLSANTARVYHQLLTQFQYSDIYKIHAHEPLSAITEASLSLWLQQWHWSKARLSIAALRFMAKCNAQAFPASVSVKFPPKPRSEAGDLLSLDDVESIAALTPEHFGKQYPERNRALFLLVIETLLSVHDIRALKVQDVKKYHVYVASRPLYLQKQSLSTLCATALQNFLQWRWQRYGHCEVESPLFPANRGGGPLGTSGLYYMFRNFINAYGCQTGSAGDGLHCLRVSAARRMYAQGTELSRLEDLLLIQRKGALDDFLRLDDDLILARADAL
ncbi:MAG: site-specific integrase [Mariprofundaceae bacterium]|nr:site-specific integrase [Mariprofundaceae bacterium]